MQPGVKIGKVMFYDPRKGAFIQELSDETTRSRESEVFVPKKLLIDVKLFRGQLIQYWLHPKDETIAKEIHPLPPPESKY